MKRQPFFLSLTLFSFNTRFFKDEKFSGALVSAIFLTTWLCCLLFLCFYFVFCFVGFLFVSIPPLFCTFNVSIEYAYRTSPLLQLQILIYLLGFVMRVPCSNLSMKTNCSGHSERLFYSFSCCYKTGSKCLVTFSWLTQEMQYL